LAKLKANIYIREGKQILTRLGKARKALRGEACPREERRGVSLCTFRVEMINANFGCTDVYRRIKIQEHMITIPVQEE
jgi:hypothetical protein